MVRRAIPWAAILALAGILLALIPGFDILSFHACLVMAPLLAMASGSLAVTAVAEAREGGRTLRSARGRAFAAAGILALVPLGILSISALFAGPCDWWYGLAFFAAGPLASAVLAVCAGLLIGVAVPRPRWASAAWSLVFVATFVLPLVDLYRQPAVFFYAPFLGYFPGPLYDVRLTVGPAYIAYRGFCLALAGALWALADAISSPDLRLRADRRARWWALAAAALGVAWALWARAGDLGFRETRADVESVLSGEVADAWCVIRHDPSEAPSRMAPLLGECGYRHRQAAAFFGVEPQPPVRVNLYRDDDQKARLMGARNVEIAKPWLGEIHVAGVAPGDPVLLHEIAHVVAGRLAPGLLRLPVRRWVVPDMARVEGLAVACAFADDGPSPHEWSLAMDLAGVSVDLPALFGPASFLNAAPSRAYTVAGSFIAFLGDVYGPEALRAVAEGQSFEGATGSALPDLEREWRAFLRDVASASVDAGLLARASGRFSGPGVLGRRCAVDVARLAGNAAEAEARGDFDGAETCLKAALQYAPGATGLRRVLLRLKAKAGDASGAADLAAGLADVGEDDDPPPMRLVDVADVLALAARVAGRAPPPDVEQRWVRALFELPPGGPEARSVIARLHVLDLPIRARDAVLDVLSGGGQDAVDAVLCAAAEVPDDALLRYLAGRLRIGDGRFATARDDLAAALALGLPSGPGVDGGHPFDAEAWKSLGKAATWAGDSATARSALSRALDLAPYEGDRLVIEEYLERLARR